MRLVVISGRRQREATEALSLQTCPLIPITWWCQQTDWQRDRFLWLFWNKQRGLPSGLRRAELGELHRLERFEIRQISRSARVHRSSRQRQSGKHLRPPG